MLKCNEKSLFMIFFLFRPSLVITKQVTQTTNVFAMMRCNHTFFLAISQSSFLWIVRAGKNLVTSIQWSCPSIWLALCSNATGRVRQIFQGDAESCNCPLMMRSNAIQEWFGCWAFPWWLLQTLWKATYWAPVNTFLLISQTQSRFCPLIDSFHPIIKPVLSTTVRRLGDFYQAEGSTYFSTEVLPVWHFGLLWFISSWP